jgi:hypothetical protein
MFIVYLIITAAVLGMTIWCFVTEKDWRKQICAAMVIIPLLLRVLLVK